MELGELDAALTRPGRVDMYIQYKRATRAQAEQLFTIFYQPAKTDNAELEDLTEVGEDVSSGTESPRIENEKGPLAGVFKLLNKPVKKDAATLGERWSTQKKAATHHPFELPPHVTQAKIAEWARLWAAPIEDEQFTIAELQGMLLAYKKDPEEAMKGMPAWIEKELVRRAAEAEKEKQRAEEAKVKAEAASQAMAAQAAGLAAAAAAPVAPSEASKKGGKRAKASKVATTEGKKKKDIAEEGDGDALKVLDGSKSAQENPVRIQAIAAQLAIDDGSEMDDDSDL